MSKPSFPVAIKGLQTTDLQGATEASLLQDLKTSYPSAARVKIWRPKDPTYTRVRVLLALTDLQEAQKVCEEGICWQFQHLICEPYIDEARPQQCFKCWKWGHTQKHCKREARCGNCAASAHTQPGQQCDRPARCPNCNGLHTARARDCPWATKAYGKAKAAYQARPKTYGPAPKRLAA